MHRGEAALDPQGGAIFLGLAPRRRAYGQSGFQKWRICNGLVEGFAYARRDNLYGDA
jgi:hypothetical protein